jgi:hypothetical protein
MKKYSRLIFAIIAFAALLIAFCLGMQDEKTLRPAVTNYVVEPNDQSIGKEAIIDFLASLHDKDYSKAVIAFGGDYGELRNWNPDIAPTDLAALWKAGCELNGLQCLEIRNLAFASQPDSDTIIYNIWFSNPDKITEFKDPQSGATFFKFTVKRIDGKLLVITPPVYVQ